MRSRLPGLVAAAVVAVAVLVGAVLWFGGTDSPSGARDDAGPGVPAPARTSPELARGNVVLLAAPAQLAAARRVGAEVAGPPSRALAGAGQAVLVRRAPGTDGVVAVAWHRELRASRATDPAVGEFAEQWLGRGSGG